MKQLLIILVTIFPLSALGNPKFWFSNKVEAGYEKIYISEQVTFEDGVFIKNATGLGFRFKMSKKIGYKTFYILENCKKNDWKMYHFIGISLSLKL